MKKRFTRGCCVLSFSNTQRPTATWMRMWISILKECFILPPRRAGWMWHKQAVLIDASVRPSCLKARKKELREEKRRRESYRCIWHLVAFGFIVRDSTRETNKDRNCARAYTESISKEHFPLLGRHTYTAWRCHILLFERVIWENDKYYISRFLPLWDICPFKLAKNAVNGLLWVDALTNTNTQHFKGTEVLCVCDTEDTSRRHSYVRTSEYWYFCAMKLCKWHMTKI